ncbi:hypothetical protein GLAREA_02657 [Glarea lozoyensis ATCC 20868]|uniref:Uncharacterized protein n=1 Tax=Glarea lozoyensis (strain ATCC 20868 / MF5171) TaxID=1116229 RepID=S3DJM8_GLAL2|nr:uncharacterized protein GLAREA_02657 [Glarea lozoyensis ATCC 20868]EPE26743.1 hypothetical protein GLAREA_02657 [Glarea lozoyensis ATCC 20868]
MDPRTSVPGGWPLHKGDSNVEKHLVPLPTYVNEEPDHPHTEPISRISTTTRTRPVSTISATTPTRPISTVSVPEQPNLLKIPTARTTQSRPFSITTGQTENVYVDAPESLEDTDEKKKPLATISSKDGSTTPASEDDSATTLAAGPPPPPQPVGAKAMFMKAAFSRYWADWWIWEFISITISTICMLAVVIICTVYKDTALSAWPHPLTPNALIAIFVALAQAGLVMPVYSVIGQLKWIWFGVGERPLVDFETFDEASRGPVGGLKLIGTLKGGGIVRHLANTGVVTAILSLAAGPFVQMMISYPIMKVSGPDAVAMAPRAELFDGYTLQPDAPGLPELSMMRAIQTSLYTGGSVALPALAPECSTGNCEFPAYSSLAVCAQVANITDKLTVTPVPMNVGGDVVVVNNYNVTLPNGAALEAGQSVVNITTAVATGSLAFSSMPNILETTIANSFIIYQKDVNAETRSFGAVEILLNWCVSTFNTTVDAAKSETHAVTNSTNVVTANGPNGALILRATEGTIDYTVDSQANLAMQSYLASTLSGSYSAGFGYFSTDAAMAISGALYERTALASVTGQAKEDMQFGGIMNATQNIAVSMTNNIRQRQTTAKPQTGKAFISAPMIKIQYGWMCYLGNLVFSSFSLLVATMWLSRKTHVDVMRNSALATASALSADSKNFMGPIDRRNKSWLKAYFLKVQLTKGEAGWSLDARM